MALTKEQLTDKVIELTQKQREIEAMDEVDTVAIEAIREKYGEAAMQKEIQDYLDSRTAAKQALATEIEALKEAIYNG